MTSHPDLSDLSQLMACPQCDALYRSAAPEPGNRAVCARCHTVLASPRRHAGMQIISMALAVVILVAGATFFPFLRIEVAGFGHSASLFDAVLVFSGEELAILAIAMAALILLIPTARALLVIYVLAPVVFDRPAARYARTAFRWSEELRPWSMAEIFAIGCAVSLIKVSDLAHVEFGPAFWMFAALVLVTLIQERFLCKWSVWQSLAPSTHR